MTAQAGGAIIDIVTARRQIRTTMLRRRRNLSVDEHMAVSAAVCANLIASRAFRSAHKLAVYLAVGREIDLGEVVQCAWQRQKRVFIPVIDHARGMRFAALTPGTPIAPNRFGIDEPAPGHRVFLAARWLDLVLAPLVAFDLQGNRIGMGGGYYDRAFAFLQRRRQWLKPHLMGVAFDFQQARAIPAMRWDVPLHSVATESGLQRLRHEAPNTTRLRRER